MIKLIGEGAGKGRFVLLINLVPLGTPVEHVHAAVAAVKQFGALPDPGPRRRRRSGRPSFEPFDEWLRSGRPSCMMQQRMSSTCLISATLPDNACRIDGDNER